MRSIRIYQPGEYEIHQSLTLSESASHHVAVVLRMQMGQGLVLFSGDNNKEFAATITQITKKTVQVRIESKQTINRESPLQIHLAQALSKNDKMELVVQKAVELGVASLTPILSGRVPLKFTAEHREKKVRQWQAIAISACEQCGRNTLPIIFPITPLDTYLTQVTASLKWILHPSASKPRPASQAMTELALLIGPEGGFAETEVTQAQAQGFEALRLGPRILRTETAAIASLSVLQACYGDL